MKEEQEPLVICNKAATCQYECGAKEEHRHEDEGGANGHQGRDISLVCPHSHPIPVSIGLDIDMEVPIGPCAEVAQGADLPYRIERFTKIYHQASPLIVVQGSGKAHG